MSKTGKNRKKIGIACVLTFAIEVISRRDFLSTISFLHNHTLAYLYNAFIVFASLSIVYLFRCRAQLRVLISGLWLFLGTINGLILSNRVTPFSYTDLKCISDLFAMQNTNYFTAEEATLVVGVVVAFFVFLGFFFAKGPKYQGKRHFVLGPVCSYHGQPHWRKNRIQNHNRHNPERYWKNRKQGC